jgi:hypothetical protein
MTFYGNGAKKPKKSPKPHLGAALPRSSAPAKMTVDEAVEADRAYFDAHPEADEYIREFVPGEFPAGELPEIPPGFRYVTHVSVIHRTEGRADGRYRRLIAVCDTPHGPKAAASSS